MATKKRNETSRKAFRERVLSLDPGKIVYVDESGFDNATRVEYGYSQKGKRCHAFRPGRATERLTAISPGSGSRQNGSPVVFPSNTDRKASTAWVCEGLLLTMPERGYIILDNASFHRYSGIEDLAKAEGHEVIWLPTYSPDLNPI